LSRVHLGDWELESFDSFFSLLYSLKVHPGEVDNLLWTPSSNQKFTVKSYYTLLQSGEHSYFPWRSVWKVKVPPRVAFFLWTAALDRILMVDTLKKRGFTLGNWCCLCKMNEETTNHLLIHCEYTSALWQLILNLFGVSWVMPNNIQEFLHCWKVQGRGHPKEAIWKVIPALLMWSIWREMNRRIFEDSETNVFFLKSSFLRFLMGWCYGLVFGIG
jgi:hypothetical protein